MHILRNLYTSRTLFNVQAGEASYLDSTHQKISASNSLFTFCSYILTFTVFTNLNATLSSSLKVMGHTQSLDGLVKFSHFHPKLSSLT